MAFIEWSESMSVGNSAVDHDHKIIVQLINQLHQELSTTQDRKTQGSTLNTLIDYTLYHFAREEQVMQACKYPLFAEHKRQHEGLTEQVADIAHRFNEKKEDIIQDELLEFLKNWLINHILKQDMGFRPYAEYNPEVQKLTSSLQEDRYQPQLSATADLIPASFDWKQLTVLIVAENQGLRHIMATILEMAGVQQIKQQSHSNDAMQILDNYTPDIIVYSSSQNGHDSLPLIKLLQQTTSSRLADIPVLLIATHEAHLQQSDQIIGVSHYIEQPIGIQSFLYAVVTTLKQ